MILNFPWPTWSSSKCSLYLTMPSSKRVTVTICQSHCLQSAKGGSFLSSCDLESKILRRRRTTGINIQSLGLDLRSSLQMHSSMSLRRMNSTCCQQPCRNELSPRSLFGRRIALFIHDACASKTDLVLVWQTIFWSDRFVTLTSRKVYIRYFLSAIKHRKDVWHCAVLFDSPDIARDFFCRTDADSLMAENPLVDYST